MANDEEEKEMEDSMIAKFLKEVVMKDKMIGIGAVQRYYEVDPSMQSYDKETYHKIIVVSATTIFGKPETYIFPATLEDGITSWYELEDSQKRTLDHEKVLRDLGYEIQ